MEYRKTVAKGSMLGFLLGGAHLVLHILYDKPGMEGWYFLNLLILPGVLIGIIPFLIWNRRNAVKAWAAMALLFCYVFAYIISSVLSAGITRRKYMNALEKGDGIVLAVQEYIDANGMPPEDLTALMPSFLEHIPSTGILLSPNFKYARVYDSDTNTFNGWALAVAHRDLTTEWNGILYVSEETDPESLGINVAGEWGRWLLVFDFGDLSSSFCPGNAANVVSK